MPFINGIGPLELIIVLVIALIVVGPGRLPDVGAALGKSIREFRQAATDTKDAVSLEEKAKSEGGPTATTAAGTTAAVAPAATPAAATAVAPDPAIPTAATAVAPPPPPAAAPVLVDPAAAPAAAASEAAPDASQLPEPVHAEDEQPTPTA